MNEAELQARLWLFCDRRVRLDGPTLRFLPGGAIAGHELGLEKSWRLQGNILTLLQADGRESVHFPLNAPADGGPVTATAPYLLAPHLNITLGLDEIPRRSLEAQDPPGSGTAEVRLLVTIPFHFRSQNVKYLCAVLREYLSFDVALIHIIIHTNAANQELANLQEIIAYLFGPESRAGRDSFRVEICSVTTLEDPWRLVWRHKQEMMERFLAADAAYTHFIYCEDDISLSWQNLKYFLRYQPVLKNHGLIPAFCITEWHDNGFIYAKEQRSRIDLSTKNIVRCGAYSFVNHNNPFNAIFILDRDMAREHSLSPSFDYEASRSLCHWGNPERASLALCLHNPPPGFLSRYVVPFHPATRQIPAEALIPHLPNKYVYMNDTLHSKFPLRTLLYATP